MARVPKFLHPDSRLAKAAAAALLLILGAVLGVVIPRAVENIWPQQREVEPISFMAYQNSSSTSYFAVEPNWRDLDDWIAGCRRARDGQGDVFEEEDPNRCFDYQSFGGVPELDGSFINITNPQATSVQIIEIRSVVDRRIATEFAAQSYYEQGDDVGTSLAFNLDRESARAVRVDTREHLAQLLAGRRAVPYFDSTHYEIETGRTVAFFMIPVSDFAGILEWHLEVTFEALNADGERTLMTAVVRPASGAFRGVPTGTLARGSHVLA